MLPELRRCLQLLLCPPLPLQRASTSATPSDLLPEHRQTTRNVIQPHPSSAVASSTSSASDLLYKSSPWSAEHFGHRLEPLRPPEPQDALPPTSRSLRPASRRHTPS